MLVLTRVALEAGQKADGYAQVVLRCGCGCAGTITLLDAGANGRTKLGLDFPETVTIVRGELADTWDARRREGKADGNA